MVFWVDLNGSLINGTRDTPSVQMKPERVLSSKNFWISLEHTALFFLNLLYSACDWRKWKLCQRLTFSQKSCQKQRLKYLNINRSIKNSYPLAQFYNVMHTFCCCKQLSPFFYLTAEKNKHEYYSFSADCGGGLQTRPTRQITTFIQCHLVTILDFFQ